MGIADNTPQVGYCIYAHVNPINNKVYIGISKDVKKRWVGKIHAYKHSTIFQNAIKKYGWDNFYHIVLWDGLTLEDACQQEKIWISLFKLAGLSYNITDGGEGHLGVPLTEEQKEHLRKVHTGKVFSDEHRKKLSEYQKKNSCRRKKVYAFNKKTGELVKEYNSVAEASKDLGIRDSGISEAANGICKTAGGFVWSYNAVIDKDKLNQKIIRPSRRKKIYCYDLNGNFIKMYDCAYDAADEVKGDYKAIHSCCLKKRLSYKGYIWRHELCDIEEKVILKTSKYATYNGRKL